GLGLARFRRVVREYFAICDSYYKALRKASPLEIETVDMARRAIHDRGTRQLLEALEGKVETDFATARRLFTLICVLHIRACRRASIKVGKKRAYSWRRRFAALLLLVALVGAGWLWWQGRHWTPARDRF